MTQFCAFACFLLLGIAAVSFSSAAFVPLRPRLDGRIVGGSAVDIKQFPYQVSLQRSYHFCGGSLIAKRVVLTAAHCTDGAAPDSFKVRLGSTLSAKGGLLVAVTKVHRHELYNSAKIDYDFSLLELEDYDEAGVTTGIAKLPLLNEDVLDGTPLTVSGWGNTQNASEPTASLRAVTVPKVSQAKCSDSYSSYGGVTDRMICAGLPEGGKDACQGDSGGPMTVNGKLVGVVSWGFGCARPNFPGVYSRVAAVRDWIATKSGV